MPRRRTGSIREVTLSDGRVAYRGRFTDQGGRRREIKLGHSPLISRAEAEQALKHWLADVDRGTWKPPAPPQPAPQEEPETFDDFVHSDWLPSRGIEIEEGGKVIAQPGQELSEGTQRNIVWSLRCHLLPFFGEDPLAAITPQRIDDWRAWALKSQGLSPTTVNRHLARLANVLDLADDYGRIEANPARGPRRRAKAHKQPTLRSWLDFDQLMALLDAAEERDEHAERVNHRHLGRRPLLASLFLGGLRVNEACALQWRHVDLRRRVIRVDDSKTPAGVREVPMGRMLEAELKTWRERTRSGSRELVFPTGGGKPRDKDDVRARILYPLLERTNKLLEERKHSPLPETEARHRGKKIIRRIATHTGRRTAATWWIEAGESPRRVQACLGHTDAALTMNIYAQVVERDPDRRIVEAMTRERQEQTRAGLHVVEGGMSAERPEAAEE